MSRKRVMRICTFVALLFTIGMVNGCGTSEPDVTPVVHSQERLDAAKKAAAGGGRSRGTGGRNATRESRDAQRR